MIDALIEMLQGNSNMDEEKGNITIGPDEDNRVMDDAERDWRERLLEENLNRCEEAEIKDEVRRMDEAIAFYKDEEDEDQEDYENLGI